MLGLGFRIQGLGLWIENLGCGGFWVGPPGLHLGAQFQPDYVSVYFDD